MGFYIHNNTLKRYEEETGVTEIVIPAGVTYIADEAFKGCERLTSITIPNGVTSIGERAFWNCSSLTSITIPAGVTAIRDRAFWCCRSLRSVTFRAEVTFFASNAFAECRDDLEIHMSDLSEYMQMYFEQSHILYLNDVLTTEIVIPDGIETIPEFAFANCCSLKRAIIPKSVVSIEEYAFLHCSDDFELHITDLNVYMKSDIDRHMLYINDVPAKELVLPEGITSIPPRAFFFCRNLERITIPAGVVSIGQWAFSECVSLKAVTLPAGVTDIGEWAFDGCCSLTDITIPDSVTSIDEWAFDGCSSLKEITLPEGLVSLEKGAFNSCSSLTDITIPEGVTSIRDWTFRGCDALKTVRISPATLSGCTDETVWKTVLPEIGIRELISCVENCPEDLAEEADRRIMDSSDFAAAEYFAKSGRTGEYVEGRLRNDAAWLDSLTAAQLLELTDKAIQQGNCPEVTAFLLDYKQKRYPGIDRFADLPPEL